MPFDYSHYMTLIRSRNWHFEWVKKSRLHKLNGLLGQYVEAIRPTDELRLSKAVHSELKKVVSSAGKKYPEAIEYIKSNIKEPGAISSSSGIHSKPLKIAPTVVSVTSGSTSRGHKKYADGSSFIWVTCPLRNNVARASSTVVSGSNRVVQKCALNETVNISCDAQASTVQSRVIEEEFANITRSIIKGRDKIIESKRVFKIAPPRRNRTQSKLALNIERYWGVPTDITMDAHLANIIKKFDVLLNSMKPGRGTQSQTLNVIYAVSAPCASGCYGFAIPSLFDNPPCFWIGPAFVTSGVRMEGGKVNKEKTRSKLFDARVMTAVHELTHAVLKTRDVVSWSKQPTFSVHHNNRNVMLSSIPDSVVYNNAWTTNHHQTFTPADCQALAQNKPRWTPENAHTYACFVAYARGEEGFDLS